MPGIAENLSEIRSRVAAACAASGRDPASVELIAVSKTFPAEAVREAHEAGQTQFGESRLQEAAPKIEVLPASLHWHFIGRVQRNKVRRILSLFGTVHAVDSLRLALYMDEIAGELGLYPKVFLQVNVGGEASKGGFEPEELQMEMARLLALRRLEIIGLMCIPPAGPDAESARPWFVALRELRDRLASEHGAPLSTLSMGMSGDFEVAIEEGATHVRVGSSIFGKRAYRVDGELG
jgi:hypothetical protein